ncbi:TonB-dependent siderophore receptor [Pelomonas sp. SE-A7]|uniref:TonB-dependent receptor n=1 Tax=Pelomonas sp. SE-A7 TaxID=3054953 RepID=UPI00259C802F|nr:TonB-dependent siderophore receptor [Pelomonas sp. SE-A7]MDM4767048.1 TonB-dependent siderophore receptor [Pelomonas sp. SE-A7]
MKQKKIPPHALLPLGALAAGFGIAGAALAQSTTPPATPPATPASAETTLPVVRAKATAEKTGKEDYQATESKIGKGKQELRDIPQSVTVVTEKLIDDRNLDTMKDVLKNTAGITFMAAEGGEEDIRLRGFPLQSTGDVFIDGMRDPAFYERDTFFYDRLEVIRGSASMLFGRGSTGGAVNQVSKAPRLLNENQIDVTVGSHNYGRIVGDFNMKTGDDQALRVGAMVTKADNNGAGSSLDKRGIAAAYRLGIGEADEFAVSLYYLDNNNGMNYGMPWIKPTLTAPTNETTLIPVDPSTYYGMASDRNDGSAGWASLSHTHRFSPKTELTTRIRKADYTRDQRAGTVRFGAATVQPDRLGVSLATFGPNTVITRGLQPKIQDLQTVTVQSDLSSKFDALGVGHSVQAGFDYAKEEKQVYGTLTAAQGGVVPTKPNTTVGKPNDGAWIDESLRKLRMTSEYTSNAAGAYVQDLVQLAPQWKVLGGLRYDWLKGDYDTFAIPNNAPTPVTTSSYRMKVSEWSKRAAVLFQPNALMSFHFGGATSFNTSGDAYSLGASNQNTPPEQSVNLELGAKLDSADGNFTTRLALFRTTKLHERNTDPLVDLVTLSGKRHAAGFEVDFSGRPMPGLEVFASFMWMPVAKIDIATPGAEGQGTRPSLTPQYSGTFWTTYQLTPQLRLGAGLNARSGQQPNRNPGFYAPKFLTGDLMAEYTLVQDKLSFKANLSNVTNKLYADSLYTGHYIPGAGRLLQVTGSYKF